MGYKEEAGVLRKLECHMGWVFGGISKMVGGVSSNLVSYRVGDGSRLRF
jgi:hypothetical protein